jgi:type IV pilus assembly protein PilE
MTRRKSSGGFTLIELMVVVAVLAALLLVALPAYKNQVIRGHRAAAKAEMVEIADRQQQFLLANRAYADKTTLEDNGFALDTKVDENYTYAIDLGVDVIPFYTITFTPKAGSIVANDGAMSLNSAGGKTGKWER